MKTRKVAEMKKDEDASSAEMKKDEDTSSCRDEEG